MLSSFSKQLPSHDKGVPGQWEKLNARDLDKRQLVTEIKRTIMLITWKMIYKTLSNYEQNKRLIESFTHCLCHVVKCLSSENSGHWKIFQKRDRRDSRPTVEIYKNRDFVAKFFWNRFVVTSFFLRKPILTLFLCNHEGVVNKCCSSATHNQLLIQWHF